MFSFRDHYSDTLLVVKETIERPIVVNVKVPDLKIPEVVVNVSPTPINVEAPNVEVNVAAPEVTVQPPNVTVEAPEVLVEPKIEVHPAEVRVDVQQPDKPTSAVIQHPDGTISQVSLKSKE